MQWMLGGNGEIASIYLQVFEAAHLEKQSLFIFDQSSALAFVPPDTQNEHIRWWEASR